MADQTAMQIILWACMTIGIFSRESLKFHPWTFFPSFVINPARSAAAQ